MFQAKRLVLLPIVLIISFLHRSEPAAAQGKAPFNAKLSYSLWSSGIESGNIYGFEGEYCGTGPFVWPPRPPRGPRFNIRFSYYDLSEKGLDRAVPLEVGLLFPLSKASRVTPYLGAGVGYYLIDGDSPNLDDELGGYGALGAEIRLGERWGLNIEGAYREVGGDLDLSGPVFKAGLGFNL